MPLTKDQAKQVYAKAFFTKLAEHGVVPQTEEEHEDLLKLASHSRKLAEVHTRRRATSTASVVKKANAFLERHFNGDAALDELIGAHSKAAEYGKGKGKKKKDMAKKDDGSC